MSKWSFGDATLVTEILFTATLDFIIEIPDDDAQINDELYISNFFQLKNQLII